MSNLFSPFRAVLLATLVAAGVHSPRQAIAQGNPTDTDIVPQSESATVQAKITAIDRKTRAVTLRGRSGDTVTVTAGPAVRLEHLKVGQTVNAQYYRSVAFMVTSPSGGNGTPAPANDEITQVLARPAQGPGGVGLRQTKITGTVVGIDLGAHRIDLVNPTGGGVYTIDVTDPSRIAMLPQLKVGDRITAVVTQALAVSIGPAPHSWF